MLAGSLPVHPSPSLVEPPPPLLLPPQSLPQLSPPFVLSALLASSPSPPAPSGSLTAVGTGQRWRLLFSEEPGKVSQEPGQGAASRGTGAGGALVFAATG